MICKKLHECCEGNPCTCADKDVCVIYKDSRKNAVCQENKKRYNLMNDKNYVVALYHMDGGIIRNEPNTYKSDFLYVIYDPDCPTAVLVELKGHDIYRALRQIQADLDRFGDILKRRICARIVCKSVPRLYNDPVFKRIKKDIMKNYKGTFMIYEMDKDEKYSEL